MNPFTPTSEVDKFVDFEDIVREQARRGPDLRLVWSRPSIDLNGVLEVELGLNQAAHLLGICNDTLRKLLQHQSAPAELQRRREPPHWRLNSLTLIEYLSKRRLTLAERLAELLRCPEAA